MTRERSVPELTLVEIVIFVASAVASGLVGYPVVAVGYAFVAICTAGALRAVMPGS